MYIAIIIGVILLISISFYNRLVTRRVRTEESWADIDVQLKRRYDLIPNLIETVKGYAAHERATLEEVLSARAKATSMTVDIGSVDSSDMAAFASAQTGLSGALGRLMAIAEAYPDLKANTNFLELQQELTDTENKIQAARRFYNTNVRDLNIAIETFPGNVFASLFNFKKGAFFELENDSKEREPVEVRF